MAARFIFGLIVILLLAGCAQETNSSDNVQNISLTTDDSIKISSRFYPGNQTGIVLVHMLGRNKETWNAFADELANSGYSVISIDLRGHGESGGSDYSSFSEAQWNSAVNDIKAAKEFLKEKGATNFYIIGGSIGSNLAIKYAATDSDISKVVLLSPSFDYRGVKTEEAAENFKGELLVVSSSEDLQSFGASEQLAEISPNGEFVGLSGAGHGTNMLGKQNVNITILDFFSE